MKYWEFYLNKLCLYGNILKLGYYFYDFEIESLFYNVNYFLRINGFIFKYFICKIY